MKRLIVLYVVFFHALFLLSLAFIHPSGLQKTTPTRLVVTTFDSSPPPLLNTVIDEIEEEEAMEEEMEMPIALEEEVHEELPPPPPPPVPKPKKTQSIERPKEKQKETKPKEAKPKDVKPKEKPKEIVKKTTPKKSVKPIAKKKTTTTTPKKKAVATAKPKPATPIADSKLLSMMQESLSQLERGGNGGKVISKGEGKKKVGTLQSEQLKIETEELSYEQELALYLKHRLQLPEPGDVKIKLTLSQAGKVISLSIVSAPSTKNKAHVEEKVPNLKFPPFDERMEGESKHTFTVIIKA